MLFIYTQKLVKSSGTAVQWIRRRTGACTLGFKSFQVPLGVMKLTLPPSFFCFFLFPRKKCKTRSALFEYTRNYDDTRSTNGAVDKTLDLERACSGSSPSGGVKTFSSLPSVPYFISSSYIALIYIP